MGISQMLKCQLQFIDPLLQQLHPIVLLLVLQHHKSPRLPVAPDLHRISDYHYFRFFREYDDIDCCCTFRTPQTFNSHHGTCTSYSCRSSGASTVTTASAKDKLCSLSSVIRRSMHSISSALEQSGFVSGTFESVSLFLQVRRIFTKSTGTYAQALGRFRRCSCFFNHH